MYIYIYKGIGDRRLNSHPMVGYLCRELPVDTASTNDWLVIEVN